MANKPWLKSNEGEEVIEVMGAKVTLKPFTYGMSRRATQASMKVDPFTRKVEMDAGLMGLLRTLYRIKDWDITDENDEKLPISLDTLDMLSEEFVNELLQKANVAEDIAVTESEKKD
jgi:hypothetical protein